MQLDDFSTDFGGKQTFAAAEKGAGHAQKADIQAEVFIEKVAPASAEVCVETEMRW